MLKIILQVVPGFILMKQARFNMPQFGLTEITVSNGEKRRIRLICNSLLLMISVLGLRIKLNLPKTVESTALWLL
jgi:hypothetical protein